MSSKRREREGGGKARWWCLYGLSALLLMTLEQYIYFSIDVLVVFVEKKIQREGGEEEEK